MQRGENQRQSNSCLTIAGLIVGVITALATVMAALITILPEIGVTDIFKGDVTAKVSDVTHRSPDGNELPTATMFTEPEPNVDSSSPAQDIRPNGSPCTLGAWTAVYYVQTGDTLSQIAARYSVGLSQLKSINCLTGDTINVGQALLVPFEIIVIPSATLIPTAAEPSRMPTTIVPTTIVPTEVSNPITDCLPYTPSNLQIVDEGATGWLLTDGRSRMLILDNQSDAQAALALAQRHTSHCFVGRSTTRQNRDTYVHEFWVGTSGSYPSIGQEDCIAYSPSSLYVGSEGANGWLLTDGRMRMLMLDNETDARIALTMAQQYTSQCFIGRNNTRNNRLSYIVEYWH